MRKLQKKEEEEEENSAVLSFIYAQLSESIGQTRHVKYSKTHFRKETLNQQTNVGMMKYKAAPNKLKKNQLKQKLCSKVVG